MRHKTYHRNQLQNTKQHQPLWSSLRKNIIECKTVIKQRGCNAYCLQSALQALPRKRSQLITEVAGGAIIQSTDENPRKGEGPPLGCAVGAELTQRWEPRCPRYDQKALSRFLKAPGSPGSSPEASRLAIQESGWCGRSPEAAFQRISSCPGRLVSVLLKPSTDGVRPTHSRESNLLHSKFIHLKASLVQKTRCKLTYKTNITVFIIKCLEFHKAKRKILTF